MLNVAAPVFKPSSTRSALQTQTPSSHEAPLPRLPLQPNFSSRALNAVESKDSLEYKPSSAFPHHFRRYGHGNNMHSVQLTGMQSFLERSFGSARSFEHRPPGSFGSIREEGHPPHLSGTAMPTVTPLKINGHNSSPSMSLGLATLTTGIVRNKVAVRLPHEGPLPEDQALLDLHSSGPTPLIACDIHGPRTEGLIDVQHRPTAYSSAVTRIRWTKRQPCAIDWAQVTETLPDIAFVTCSIYPGSRLIPGSLPDTIDIYLPGMSAWEDLLLHSAVCPQPSMDDVSHHPASSAFGTLNPLAAPFQSHFRFLSLSAPSVGTTAPLSCLESDLDFPGESLPTSLSSHDDTLPKDPSPTNHLHQPAHRREIPAQQQVTCAKLNTGFKHGGSMSLNLPSSGGAFAPDVFSALDLIRSEAEGGITSRNDLPGAQPAHILHQTRWDGLERLPEDDVEGPLPCDSRSPRWENLGAGFGYFSEELPPLVRDMHLATRASHDTPTTIKRDLGGNEAFKEKTSSDLDRDEEEVRTNPSEDAYTSDFDDNYDHVVCHNWQFGRKSFPSKLNTKRYVRGKSVSENNDEHTTRESDSATDEAYSNPSDEEAARERRMLRRQHPLLLRQTMDLGRQGSAHADTNHTLPSSSIEEADLYECTRQTPRLSLRDDEEDVVSNPSDESAFDLASKAAADRKRNTHPCTGESRELDPTFTFPGQSNATAPALGRPAAKQSLVEGPHHLRLPSITISDYNGKTPDMDLDGAFRLNVLAPAFQPAAFTFTAPDGIRLSLLESASISSSTKDVLGGAGSSNLPQDQREAQGREKRQRQAPVGQNKGSENAALYSAMAAQPKGSNMNELSTEREVKPQEPSKTKPVEELALRIDRALEGWAGRILDEVTIMGQVRPRHASKAEPDITAAVEAFSQRLERVLERRLPVMLRNHSRTGSADISDDTESTIKAAECRVVSSAEQVHPTGLVGACEPFNSDDLMIALDNKLREQQIAIEQLVSDKLSSMSSEHIKAERRAAEAEAAYSELLAVQQRTEEKSARQQDRLEQVLVELNLLKNQQRLDADRFAHSLAEAVAQGARAEQAALAAQAHAEAEMQRRLEVERELNTNLQAIVGTPSRTTQLEVEAEALTDLPTGTSAMEDLERTPRISSLAPSLSFISSDSKQDVTVDDAGWWR